MANGGNFASAIIDRWPKADREISNENRSFVWRFIVSDIIISKTKVFRDRLSTIKSDIFRTRKKYLATLIFGNVPLARHFVTYKTVPLSLRFRSYRFVSRTLCASRDNAQKRVRIHTLYYVRRHTASSSSSPTTGIGP